MSTSSGKVHDKDLRAPDLLTMAINDILKQPLRIARVVDGCTSIVKGSRSSKCTLISFGPNSVENMITQSLSSETDVDEIMQEDLGSKVPQSLNLFGDAQRTSKKPKLAIVGMAGRFPNAADHEKFWDLLEAGLDVHRKVH